MEDLIDFPVSDDWLDWYHRQGLTPRSSGRMNPTERRLFENIERILNRLERLIEIHEMRLNQLEQKLQKPEGGKKIEL